MNEHTDISRRSLFQRTSDGLFGMALASLVSADVYGQSLKAEAAPELSGPPRPLTHFPAKAKAVIHLCMQGGPSQVDLFDPKPALKKFDGKEPPRDLTQNAVFENDRRGQLMQSPWKFR